MLRIPIAKAFIQKINIFKAAAAFLINKLGLNRFGHQRVLARDEVTELIRDTINFDSHETMLLTNILELRDIIALDVMVPRADIVAIDINDDYDAIIEAIITTNHSRVPVCKSSLDEVQGFLHIKDVARFINDAKKPDFSQILRQPLFIAPTMRALDLLQEMRLKRLHLALVVDEYGGVDGLITIEDLIEEIVGEIKDEHDEDTTPVIIKNTDGTLTVEARVEITTLEAMTGRKFDTEGMEEIGTIGGLVASLAGRVPGQREIIRHPNGVEFEILESYPRRIAVVKVCGLERTQTPQPENKIKTRKSA